MRVAIITESYAPEVNGVANSVVRIAGHLAARGHSPLVIAPRPKRARGELIPTVPYPVVRLRSLPLPGYSTVRLGLPSHLLAEALREYRPDVVHLASPFVLGAWGSKAAAELGLPIVAVYQTDVPGYARAYRVGVVEAIAWRWIRRVHGRAGSTLAPSSTTAQQLTEHGVDRVHRWGRGVDTEAFHPGHRSEALRRSLAPNGEVIVGYVGRVSREKRVELLAGVGALPGVRLVIVGDGPARGAAERALPSGVFFGTRTGVELSRLYASFDVFAHTGPYETFCQTVQEALASGVPVVAPATGGPLDLVQPGRTGMLVPAGDADALTDAVARLVRDTEMRRSYGLAARDSVAGRGWAVVGDELIAHYRTAIAEHRALDLARVAR